MKVKTYNIKKGYHSPSGFHFAFTFKKNVSFKCKFDKSCLYGDLGDGDTYDINKLCGFSTTWFHHNQSGRIGWRCLDGKTIQIVTYSYNAGNREQKETDILGNVKPNEEFVVSITDNEDSYIYSFEKLNEAGSYIRAFDRKQKDWFIFHYLLHPYFGGNKTAPHDMKISVQRMN